MADKTCYLAAILDPLRREDTLFDWVDEVSAIRAEADGLTLTVSVKRWRIVEKPWFVMRSLQLAELPGRSLATVRLVVVGAKIVRVLARPGEAAIVPPSSEMLVNREDGVPSWSWREDGETVCLETDALRLVVDKSPWQLRFYDRAGRLLTRTGRGVYTTDCPVKDLDVYPLGWAVIPATGDRLTCESWRFRHDEHFYGLGEQFGAVDRRGREFRLWTTDVAGAVNDRHYKPIPFCWSTGGYGFFVHTARPTQWLVGNRSHQDVTFCYSHDLMDYFFLHGPSPKEILAGYTHLTGRAPRVPNWSFGLWMSRCSYSSSQQVLGIAREMRRREVPCDVLHIDSNWFTRNAVCDWRFDGERFPDPPGLFAELASLGFKATLWQFPYISEGNPLFAEAKAKGYLIHRADGTLPSIGAADEPVAPGSAGDRCGILDLTNPEARSWYRDRLLPLLQAGAAAIKADFGEATPVEGDYQDHDPEEMHNLYPLLYSKLVFELTREFQGDGEALIWVRAAYAGSQRYPVHWSGDPECDWNAMAGSLRGGLSLGLSGFTYWSVDLGGFQGRPDPQLYIRWAQMGLLASHARAHGAPPREFWEFGPEALRIIGDYVRLRYRLLPYLVSESCRAAAAGLPVLRHLVLDFPDDPAAPHIEDQYLLGESLLVAPVLCPENERSVYLPRGDWYDFWTKKRLAGERWLRCVAPLERLPLFVRAGSIVPFGPDLQYTGEKPWEPLTLEVYPGRKTELAYVLEDSPEGAPTMIRVRLLPRGARQVVVTGKERALKEVRVF